ncbi:MAG: EAL domain-containing protein, partial [Ilumatobacteraceae bacterium]
MAWISRKAGPDPVPPPDPAIPSHSATATATPEAGIPAATGTPVDTRPASAQPAAPEPASPQRDRSGPEQIVYVSVPIFDAHEQIVDLRIADVDDDQRDDSNAYRAAVGRLGSALFTDPAKMIVAASVAWKQGNAEPFTTQRRYDEGIGSGLADCQVTTMRLGDRILQICHDLASRHVLAPSDTLLRSVIESADLAVMLFKPLLDADGHVTDVEVLWHNDAATQIWGATMMRVGQRVSDLDDDDPTLVELADEAWHDGTVSRLRRLPELGRGELTTISQSIQRVGDHLVEVAIDLTTSAETNQALRHLETRFGKTLDAVTDAIVVVQPSYDDDGRFADGIVTYANDAVLRMFGPLIEASSGDDTTTGGDDEALTLATLGFRSGDLAFEGVAAAATGQRIDRLFGASTETNSTRLAHLALAHATFTPMANEVLVVIRDLSQLHHARGQLERAIALDELVVDALSEPAVIFQNGDDGRPTIIAANEAARGWLPHPPPLSIDDLPFRAAAPVMERGVREAIDHATPSRDTHIVQEGPDVPDADVVAVRFVHSPMAGFRSLMVVHDVSSEINEGRRYRRQSRQDPETGLLNSVGFLEDLDERLETGGISAITALRLDQFERVEAMLGPSASNTIVLNIIDRVEALAPADTILARLRFMTFAFALPAGLDRDEIADFARAVTATVDQPFVVDGKPDHIGGHVGIVHLADAVEANDGDTAPAIALVQHARVAANKAQQLHVPHIVWDRDLEQDQPRRIELLGRLEQAMIDRELHMVFQPHVAPDGGFLGAEALVRWTHPSYGLLSPAEFIDLVETSTLILPFTAYVLREALVAYGAAGLPGPCSVNVPPALLSDPGFIPTVRGVLAETDTDPSRLCIEVTERGLMRVADHVSRATAQLHELGCFVAMDDFGSGSTSLAHLARLGFDSLKVDRQIIAGIDADPINRAVLEGIVRIAGA